MTRALSMIPISISLLLAMACKGKPNGQVPNDTTAMVQAILDSKLLHDSVLKPWEGLQPRLYTRFLIKGKAYGTFVLGDSNYIYQGKTVKVSDTAFDINPYKYPRYPHLTDFVIGLGDNPTVKGNHAKIGFVLIQVNRDIDADMEKKNGKWEVVSYESGEN